MIVDIFNHVLLPRYKELIYQYADRFPVEKSQHEWRTYLTDYKSRIELLEKYNLCQIVSTTIPPIEEIVDDSKKALEMAKICNDEMAELVSAYPNRFIGAIANIPLNDVNIGIKETARAIEILGFKGIQVYTSVKGKPLSSEEFFPLYEVMREYDLPIWVHPLRRTHWPDYPTENVSYNQISSIFGWPFETTAAMTRLIFAGIFERLPGIKFIIHHAGGMVPYFSERIVVHYDCGMQRLGFDKNFPGLTKHPIEYFKMFYIDTALDGNASALKCALEFYGEDRILFGTDMPYDVNNGEISIKKTLEAVESMGLSDDQKFKIYSGNAKKLLRIGI